MKIEKGAYFILSLGIYISMVLFEGFFWKGVFWKHLKLQPIFFLVLSIVVWIKINKNYLRSGEKYDRYFLLARKVIFLCLPFFLIISGVIKLFRTEEIRLYILNLYDFHWFLLIDSIWEITLILLLFTGLDPKLMKWTRKNIKLIMYNHKIVLEVKNKKISFYKLQFNLILTMLSFLIFIFYLHCSFASFYFAVFLVAITLVFIINIIDG